MYVLKLYIDLHLRDLCCMRCPSLLTIITRRLRLKKRKREKMYRKARSKYKTQ